MTSETDIRILTTSDTHGSLLNVNYANNETTGYGMSLISTLIKENRTENSVLIDCGDTIQGSPLMYFHQLNREKYENPVSTVFNHLKYDYFIPGNHDFNYGKSYLESFTNQLNATSLCANIVDSEKLLTFDKEYAIHSFSNGIQIAVIGLTTDYIPNWERPLNIEGLQFISPIKKLELILEEIKKVKVHAIVVVYHGGFEKDLDTFLPYVQDTGENVGSKMLEMFPQINCLLTGHQHRSISKKVRDTSIIQPASNGRVLGVIDLHFMFHDNDWKISKTNEFLLPAKDVVADSKIYELIKDVHEPCNIFLDEPIGTVPNNDLQVTNLFLARLQKHKIVTFINEVQLEASKAMISATSLGNDITGFNENITIRNVLSTYVYPNTLTVLKIDGLNLRFALERNAEYFTIVDGEVTFSPKYSYPKMEHYNYDMFDGIYYTIDVTRPVSSRITSLKYGGFAVKDNDVFTLVLNNYRASGGGEFEMYQHLELVKEIQLDISELMVEFIRTRKTLRIQDIQNIKVEF
ncbi:MAG: bifunctional UDP-sugar hydrolase/5'-nucleotidase [Candidatus Izemoplasmatales bacterium]|nr:bifunctional UDP-sugar hydrolase/5'-nucleotidase [Candidatus Izemoplasmatales bacterium]